MCLAMNIGYEQSEVVGGEISTQHSKSFGHN